MEVKREMHVDLDMLENSVPWFLSRDTQKAKETAGIQNIDSLIILQAICCKRFTADEFLFFTNQFLFNILCPQDDTLTE